MRRKPKEYWELQKTVIIESSDLPQIRRRLPLVTLRLLVLDFWYPEMLKNQFLLFKSLCYLQIQQSKSDTYQFLMLSFTSLLKGSSACDEARVFRFHCHVFLLRTFQAQVKYDLIDGEAHETRPSSLIETIGKDVLANLVSVKLPVCTNLFQLCTFCSFC